jgi:peptidoglycan hydrolase-like protein with peptidoglycan-binding domain
VAAAVGVGGLDLTVGAGAAAAAGSEPAATTAMTAMTAMTGATGTFPWIISCGEWGARPPSSPVTMDQNTTRKIVVHHMAFPNVTDYSRAHAIELGQQCQNLHMDTNGWLDTGQHFTISRGGYVLEGRHRSLEALQNGSEQVTSAQCIGENLQSIGIENEGTYTDVTPPTALFDSLVELCCAIVGQYGIHAYNIFGHWDWNFTACPGIAFYKEFPRLRFVVGSRTGLQYANVPARTWPDIYTSSAGATVWTLQYLLVNQGYTRVTPGTAASPGSFDAATVAAVQDWQRKHGFTVASDGTVTNPTWESLGVTLTPTSSGPAVKAAQSMLRQKGYQVTVNGVFDAATQTAVQQMQVLHGLPSRALVDTDTWCAIVGGIVKAEFLGL